MLVKLIILPNYGGQPELHEVQHSAGHFPKPNKLLHKY